MLKEAAAIFVVSEAPLRLLWGRRALGAPGHLGGFQIVPGGSVEPSDDAMGHRGGEGIAARVAALRELFEETGLLFAEAADTLDSSQRSELRDLLRDEPEAGRSRFAAHGLRWRTDALEPAGRWPTPEHAKLRYDTRFFALRVKAPLEVDPDLFELDDLEWIAPEVAVARWRRGELLMTPPIGHALRQIARDGRVEPARLATVRGGDGRSSLRWEVVPGLEMQSFRTPTLPPATHTNAFLVGSREAVVIEPSTPYADEQARFVAWVREAEEAGIEPVAILATHHHGDHVGGAAPLAAALGLPIWAHAETASRMPPGLVSRHLDDGERITLDGPEPRELVAIHTPGHAPGHLCFRDEASGLIVAGDMVASVGTILVEPVDGDMGLYLGSLRRLAALKPSQLLPAHGGPVRDPQALLTHYLQHRLARENKVVTALERAGSSSAEGLVPTVYDDAPVAVWPLAALQTEAHLLELERQGRAERAAGEWRLIG